MRFMYGYVKKSKAFGREKRANVDNQQIQKILLQRVHRKKNCDEENMLLGIKQTCSSRAIQRDSKNEKKTVN